MTWYNEPSQDEVEAARAAVFLTETKRALRNERIQDVVLRLHVKSTAHNQRAYCLHATIGHVLVTPDEGHYVHRITGTPHTTARMIAMFARNAARKLPGTQQQPA